MWSYQNCASNLTIMRQIWAAAFAKLATPILCDLSLFSSRFGRPERTSWKVSVQISIKNQKISSSRTICDKESCEKKAEKGNAFGIQGSSRVSDHRKDILWSFGDKRHKINNCPSREVVQCLLEWKKPICWKIKKIFVVVSKHELIKNNSNFETFIDCLHASDHVIDDAYMLCCRSSVLISCKVWCSRDTSISCNNLAQVVETTVK